uniref:lysoplasmalogenase family protein n=1 Tax=Flavobacterium sp. TaxID=239 RepID=UPI00404AAC17
MSWNLIKWLVNKLNASLFLYFSAFFLYLLSILISSENLSLIAKPIIIPSIFAYYFLKLKSNFNYWFFFSLSLFFIGDMLYLINENDFFELGLMVFLTPYFIVLFFIYEDFNFLYEKRIPIKINFPFFIVFFAIIYILVNLLIILNTIYPENFWFFVFFSIALFLMGTTTSILYLSHTNRKIYFLSLAVISFLISDIFFVMNKAVYSGMLILQLISAFSQNIAYFFFVKYIFEKSLYKSK